VIFDVRDLLIEVPDYTDVPRIDLQQALQSSQGGGGGQSPFREAGNVDRQQQLRDREQRIDDLISIITSNIDFEGWQENGGDTGKIQKLTNSGNLIITNTPKNLRAIAGLLSKLREIRAMQINVETRFLLVNQDFFEQIGFDVDVYLNANNNQIRTAQATVPTANAGGFFQRGRLQNTGTFPNQVGTGTTTVGLTNPAPWSPVGFTQDSLGLANGLAPRTDWSDAILAAAPALGIAGQFLDDVQVDFLITATQADRRAISLTAPRLTFTNGQTANIYVATQTAFVSDLQPVVGDSAVGFDPTVSVVTEGVTMVVEGTVTADRRYVTMNVDAGVARVDGFAQQSVSAVAGGQLVSSASVQSFIQLPKVTVTRVRTTVTVPDQGTILLGGQRLVTEYEVETGVPVLSKLPIINRFFTNRIESKEEQTLLILIKPTILIQNEEEERNYPGLLDSLKSGFGFGG
jgi:general secretion pathway protein D